VIEARRGAAVAGRGGVWFALFLGACHPDAISVPTAAAADVVESTESVGPAVSPGEALSGKIFVLGVEAARAEVFSCRDQAGEVHVHLEATSSGIAATLQRATMEMDTVLSADELRPVTDWADADVGGKLRRYDVRFGTDSYDYQYHRSSGPPVRERVRLPEGEGLLHDLHTGVLLLRTWRPRPGTVGHFAAVLGRHLWLTDVVFRGPDVVLQEDGPFPAVRLEGVTRKQHRDPAQRETRHFELWFSDDPDRIPLRAKTESAFGDIWLEMTEYRRDADRACVEHARIIPLPGDPEVPPDQTGPQSAPSSDTDVETGW
jgi:hypothetical protein